MAEVTWFKVLTDIFADDKIKIIQSMPEGDSLLVTWFKVLSQAGKTNDGGYIYLRKNIPYTPAMLATLFNKPQMIVELALKTFTQFEMIDIDENGYIFVTNWEKHQSIDALEKIKEKDRIRSSNYRERKRLELNGRHVTVTLPSQSNHGIELELDLELEKEKDKKNITTAGDEFKIVLDSFCLIHGKAEHQVFSQITDIQRLIDKGIPSSTIISVMKEKHAEKARRNESVNSFSYYHKAIIDAWEGGKKVEEYGGSLKSVRSGSNQAQSARSEGESKIYRGKWDDTVIPMPGMSG